jgi:MFS family permease
MLVATLTFGVGLVAFGFARWFWLAMVVLPFVGAGFMVEMASTNTILQTITEERLRGRVMAFYTMAFFGSAPIGSLLAGVAADRIGAPATIILGGVACVAAGVWLMLSLPKLRELVRPIYIERGILAASQADNAKAVGVP